MDTKKKYQTISEFMQVPFNDRASASMNKTNKYAEEYQKEKAADKIKVEGILIISIFEFHLNHIKITITIMML